MVSQHPHTLGPRQVDERRCGCHEQAEGASQSPPRPRPRPGPAQAPPLPRPRPRPCRLHSGLPGEPTCTPCFPAHDITSGRCPTRPGWARGRGLTMASSASSSFMRLSLRSSWERSAVAWSVASLAWRRSSHFSRSSRSFSLARALTASSLSCGKRPALQGARGVGHGLPLAQRALTPRPEEAQGGPTAPQVAGRSGPGGRKPWVRAWLCHKLAGRLEQRQTVGRCSAVIFFNG